MQKNHLTSNPDSLFGMAALALAIGAFVLTVTGSLREAFDLALSRQEATLPSVTVRPLKSTSLTSQETIIRALQHVEGVQGVAATLHGTFKPEEERHSPTIRLPDTIQGTWSELPGLEFPLLSGEFPLSGEFKSAVLSGRLPQPDSTNEAVIGYELAQRLGKKVGDTLVVNEYPLVIVGIRQPSVLWPGNVIQAPYDIVRQWLLPRSERGPALNQSSERREGSVGGFDEMAVILAPGCDTEVVARRLWDQVPQVEVLSPAQKRAERRQAMLALDLVVLYSVLLTVLVGGATTLNATLVAASPPLLRKGAGGSGLMATLAGGLGGFLAGWLATLGLNAYTVHHQAQTLFIVTPRLAGGVLLLSGLVGLAAGGWPALWARLRPLQPSTPNFQPPIPMALAVLGVALVTPGVMLVGSLVESLYCSLGEGQRVAANRIGLEPVSAGVAYYEPLADALRRWPGILGIAVEAYGGAIVEDEERWIDRLPPSGVVYGLRLDGGDFGLGVPYRVGLWQGRDFQAGSLDEAVLGYDLAVQQGLEVGDTLAIRDHDFTVVGVRQRLAYGRMNDFNLRAEVSLEGLRRVLGQLYAFGTITVFIPPAEREEDRALFLARLVERFSGTALFTAKDRLAEIARGFPGLESLVVENSDDTLLRARLLYFGLLAGVTIPLWGLAGLGMISALSKAAFHSHQEIQLRKLFGASDGDILAWWLERAAVWGGIGGLIGVGSGWLLIEAVLRSPFSILHPPLIVTMRLVVTTWVVAVLVGVVAGLGPAWQAARLNPVEGPLGESLFRRER